MRLRMTVACHDASGEPEFYFCFVKCSREQSDDGWHYERAIEAAKENGYEGPFVAFDEQDRAWLFDHFEWQSASTYEVDKHG